MVFREPKTLTRFNASHLLSRCKETIIRDWVHQCQEKITVARKQDRFTLIDSLPKFLDELSETLSSFNPKVESETNSVVASEHGAERATNTDFSLDQIIFEYHLLRVVLINNLEAELPLDSETGRIIHEFIDLGIRKASTRFTDFQSSITNAVKAELEFERHKFATLFHEALVPMALLQGPALVFELVNPAYEQVFSDRQVVGKKLLDVFPELQGQAIPNILKQVFRDGKPFIAKEAMIPLKNRFTGSIENRYFDLNYVRVDDLTGKPYGVYSYSLDITTQVVATREVERARRQLHDFFMQAPQPVAILEGPDFRFTLVNLPFEVLVGRELMGRALLDVFTLQEVSNFISILRKVYKTGEPFNGKELPLNLVDVAGVNHCYWLNFGYYPFRSETGEIKGIFAIVQDVTAEVESRKKIETTVRDLKLERELRERFVSGLTHDLRTPLTAAKLSAQFLSRKKEDPAAVDAIAARIGGNMDRADQMIMDLLDANLIKAGGKLPVEFERCVLNQIVSGTLSNLTTVHGDRFVVQASSEIVGYWSSSALRRMLENLCSNAIKYGDEAGLVTISLGVNNSIVTIEVHNEGPPIGNEEQKLLFEPFMRTQSAQKGKQKGWGIGLTLVQGISEAHSGTVRVESSWVRGTKFIVQLPIDSRVAIRS